MARVAARMSMKVEVRLTAITSSHCSSFITMNRLSLVSPALLTRMSSAAELGDRLVDELGHLRLVGRGRRDRRATRSRARRRAASSLSTWRPEMATVAPCLCRRAGDAAADAAGRTW